MSYKDAVLKLLSEKRLERFNKDQKKTQNPFVKCFRDDNLIKYSPIVRSIESMLGNLIQEVAGSIVDFKHEVFKEELPKNIKPDLLFKKKKCKNWSLIELKLGGKLDSKKANGEILSLNNAKSKISKKLNCEVKPYFATAYLDPKANYQSLDFNKDQLLIGKDFWEFISNDSKCYDFVLKALENSLKKYWKGIK